MIEVRQTEIFARWLVMAEHEPGSIPEFVDFRSVIPVIPGVSELRIDYGPGYRVYFVRRSEALVVLVSGGDKRTQDHDIAMAIKLAREL